MAPCRSRSRSASAANAIPAPQSQPESCRDKLQCDASACFPGCLAYMTLRDLMASVVSADSSPPARMRQMACAPPVISAHAPASTNKGLVTTSSRPSTDGKCDYGERSGNDGEDM